MYIRFHSSGHFKLHWKDLCKKLMSQEADDEIDSKLREINGTCVKIEE